MNFVQLKNLAGSSLVLGIEPGTLEIQVQAADAERFPALTYPGDCFFACLVSDAGNHEYVCATARDGNRITVVRGQEGTSALAFPAGTRFELRVTARAWELLAENRWQRPRDDAGNVLLPSRVDADSFTLSGDRTALFQANRAVHLFQSVEQYGFVLTSEYAAGADVTTVTVQNCSVDTGLSYVEVGLDALAAPKYGEAARADTADTAADADLLDGQTRAEIVAEARAGLGSAAARNIGTAADQVPLMGNLGSAAGYAVGTEAGNLVSLGEDGKFPTAVLPELGANLNAQVFTSSGTFTAPKSGNYYVRVQGGGQGGGGASTNAGASSAPPGGGRGGFCAFLVELAEGQEVAVTVGNGGAGTTTSTGGSGGLSSFGSYGTAPGGGANTACSLHASVLKLAVAGSHTRPDTYNGEDSHMGGGCRASAVPATFGGGGLGLLGTSQTYGTYGGPGLVTVEWV